MLKAVGETLQFEERKNACMKVVAWKVIKRCVC